MTALPTLKLRVLPTFPSAVIGSSMVTVTKSNGIYTLGFSINGIGTQTPSGANLATDYSLVWDSAQQTWIKVSLLNLFSSTPVVATLGSSVTFAASNLGGVVFRKNSGTPMTDLLPGGVSTLAANSILKIKNQDATALYEVSPSGGATLDGATTNFVVLGPGQYAEIASDGTNYFTILAPSRAKLALHSTITLYVSTTGSDTNPGLTATQPLQTLQGLMNYLFNRFSHGGASVTLQCAPGTYAGFSSRGGLDGHYGDPTIIYPPTLMLRGDPAAVASYVINSEVSTVLGKSLHIEGFTIQNAAGYGVHNDLTGGEIVLHTIAFGVCSSGCVLSEGGWIFQEGPWAINGDSPFVLYCDQGAQYNSVNGINAETASITFNGARTFSNFVIGSSRGSNVNLAATTFVIAGGASVTTPLGKWATSIGGTIDQIIGGVATDLNTLIPGTVSGSNRTPVAVNATLSIATADNGQGNPTLGLNLANANTWTQPITLTFNQNGSTAYTVNNNSTGTAGGAQFSANNSADTAGFGIKSTGYTTLPILTNRAFIDATSGSAGIVLNNEGAKPIVFGISSAEVGRWSTTPGQLDVGLSTVTGGVVGLYGATSGQLKVKAAAVAGANTLTLPAGTTDFSATGGANQFVKQSSAGGPLTVAAIVAADITGLSKSPIVIAQNATALIAAATNYLGSGGLASSPNEATVQFPMPDACTLDRLYANFDTSPSAGKNRVITVRKNGVDTALTVTVNGTNTIGSDLTHSVAFAAQDLLSIKIVTDAASTTSNGQSVTMRCSM